MKGSPKDREEFFFTGWQLSDNSWHPAKGFASGLQRAFGASLLTLSKRQERQDGKAEGDNQISEETDVPAYR